MSSSVGSLKSVSSNDSARRSRPNKTTNRKGHDHSHSSHLSIPSGGDSTTSVPSNKTSPNFTNSNKNVNIPNRISNKQSSTVSMHHASSYVPAHYNSSTSSNISSLSLPHYLQRMLDIQQMDIQSALDQMITLCTIYPQKVYKTSYYRKQTKNHWARDDPAFAALQIFFIFLSSIVYCIAFAENHATVSGILQFALQNILINWGLSGCIVTSLGRALANHYLTVHNNLTNHSSTGMPSSSTSGGGTTNIHVNSLHVKQSVEWLYAFDIHCNAFFPLFILLYGVQFFLLPLVLGNSFFALTLSNTLYAFAFSWYFYITHLGYRALPFLTNTEVFLLPIVGVLCIYTLNFIGYPMGLGWNASRLVAHFYFD